MGNCPIKSALIGMCDDGDINTDDDVSKACVSWFSIKIAAVGTVLFVDAWNSHTIPVKCIPHSQGM